MRSYSPYSGATRVRSIDRDGSRAESPRRRPKYNLLCNVELKLLRVARCGGRAVHEWCERIRKIVELLMVCDPLPNSKRCRSY